MRRNLYFFSCPANRNNDIWKWNIQRVLSYWPVFNGRKLIVIAQGPDLRPPEEVMALFSGRGAEFAVVPNDPERRETESFIEGLSKFETKDPSDAIFYAHSKGVSYGSGPVLESIMRWCDAMYLMNLGSIPLVEAILGKYCAMGCFRQKMDLAGSSWHYSGTFFWMRSADLFVRDWRKLHPSKFAVEGYPGRIFREDESFDPTPYVHPGTLYHEAPAMNIVSGWFSDALRKAGINA